MTGIRRFVRLGLQDADRRLGRVTALVSAHERDLLEMIESSGVFRCVSLVVDRLQAAGSSSAMLAYARTACARWSAAHWSLRRLMSGVTLMTAAATHVILTVLKGAAPGWLWLVVPAMAMAIAALLVIASGRFWRGKAAS